MQITIPHNFKPRDYQLDIYNCFPQQYRNAFIVWHRRAGKDKLSLNILIREAVSKVGVYYYVFPYYKQGRLAIYEGIDNDGFRYIDHIPSDLIAKKSDQDMRIELKNGSIIRFVGSDRVDTIVGPNPQGIVFSEYSLQKPQAWELLRPILVVNKGWALFNGTPRGLNHAYRMYEMGKRNPKWYVELKGVDETGVVTEGEIDELRASGMPEYFIQQEFYCKWSASEDDVLVPLEVLQKCSKTVVSQDEIVRHPAILGVDVAYAPGGDDAVIAQRRGRWVAPFLAFNGMDNMALANRIVEQIKLTRSRAVMIDAGRGEGVISRLDQLGYGNVVFPQHFGGRSYSELYRNKRNELMGKIRDFFYSPETPQVPYDESLFQALSSIRFTLNEAGQFEVDKKKQLKTLGLKGLDKVDALGLTFAEDVEEVDGPPDPYGREAYSSQYKERQYDPLAFLQEREGGALWT